jgi:hypothetical protein
MPRLLVIADDLTGANDVGAQFAKQGVPVLVRPCASVESVNWTNGLEVQALSSESRHLPALAAAEKVRALVTEGLAAGVTHFFKKTDSTMRAISEASWKPYSRLQALPVSRLFPPCLSSSESHVVGRSSSDKA